MSQVDELHKQLEELDRAEIATEEDKRSAMKEFKAELDTIKEERKKVLDKLTEIENGIVGLPFDEEGED